MGQRYRSIEDQKLGDGLARNQQNFAESGGIEFYNLLARKKRTGILAIATSHIATFMQLV